MPYTLFATIVLLTLGAMLLSRRRLSLLADNLYGRVFLVAIVIDIALVFLHLATGRARAFNLNAERNWPTWFSTVQLFAVALAVERGRRQASGKGAVTNILWGGVIALFALLAIDESLTLHERIGKALSGRFFRDFFLSYYDRTKPTAAAWVFFFLPFILAALAFLATFYRRCLSAASRSARRFFVSGIFLFAAAIVVELIGNRFRGTSLYPVLQVLEESCELVGASAFLGWAAGINRLEKSGGRRSGLEKSSPSESVRR